MNGARSTSTRTDTEPLLVDRLQAARLLGVSGGTIDNLRIKGELASLRIGVRRLYHINDIRGFIESRKSMVTT